MTARAAPLFNVADYTLLTFMPSFIPETAGVPIKDISADHARGHRLATASG